MACRACKIADIASQSAYYHMQVVGPPEAQNRVSKEVDKIWKSVHTQMRKELKLKGKCSGRKR